jgi:hypothetical protein
VVPLPLCGPPLLGCSLAWTLVLAPCFFLSLSWVLSFYEVQYHRWCKNKKNKRSLTSRPLKKVQSYQITPKEAEKMKTRQKKILKSKKH